MAMHQINPQGAKLAALDPIWDRVRSEAEDIVRREPELGFFIYSTVLNHARVVEAVVETSLRGTTAIPRPDGSSIPCCTSRASMPCRSTVWRIGSITKAARILPY